MLCEQLQANDAGIQGPVVLVVLDGVGIAPHAPDNAVTHAHTPNLQHFASLSLSTQLLAHGPAVGMPSQEDMGNSEVGHNALGAGRVFDQGAKRVTEAVQSHELFQAPVWQQVLQHVQQHESTLHFIGLLSDGNVHSHIDHLLAMLQVCHAQNIARVRIHVLLDGRDVAKVSAHHYVQTLEALLSDINQHPQRSYLIASGGGRMQITMDRYEADWPMVERGYRTHVLGDAPQFASALQAIQAYREQQPGIGDQDLPPFVIAQNHQPVGRVCHGDAMIAFNFRGDRMLEWVRVFEDDTFTAFDRGPKPDVLFAGMTLYDGDTQRPQHYLVSPPHITCTLSELLCERGVQQLAISETQKFGHVTYFWNGNRSDCFDANLEKYIEVPSLTVPFEQQPHMRAEAITDHVIQELQRNHFRFIRINYPNGDMIGHTGNFEATVEAMNCVDVQLGRLWKVIEALNGAMIVTADHGNAEEMAERDKKTHVLLRDEHGRMLAKTSHSLNPVPFYPVLTARDLARYQLAPIEHRGLGHVAATLALLLGFHPPHLFLPSLLQRR